MVAPVGFCSNAETILDNHFMSKSSESNNQLEHKALLEFSALHQKLRAAGINIWVHAPEHFHGTPDAVFPNNWFSTHPGSEMNGPWTVAFYPMKTPSRRAERREHIISEFQEVYGKELSFTHWEYADVPGFLESTGVLVLDRINKIAYANLSERCHRGIAESWGKRLGYKMCLFHSTDSQGRALYHTNVMMSIGTSIAVVCLESVEDPQEKQELLHNLNATGKHILEISREQMNNYCGNCIELKSSKGKLMCMSEKAYQNFTESQKAVFLQHVDEILHSDLTTIEVIGGGSLRCMIGELF
uniref:Amidinotransferase n=1 Tax=Arcella intermedia TaxID=1963864 RepID=A0A6B2LBN9_9EUKA